MNTTQLSPSLALQTFQIRPTPSALPAGETVDELMIDWSGLPAGSSASIYLPAVSADDVLALASGMYVTHRFSRVDAHTLACAAGGISYLPVPKGFGQDYAGLLAVSLPAAAAPAGDVPTYNVVVRQVTTSYQTTRGANANAASRPKGTRWRQVLGTFQVSLSTKPPEEALLATERLYGVFQWISEAIAPTDRWYPVFVRYLGQLAGVITGLGGNPGQIPPSPTGEVPGFPAPKPRPVPCADAGEVVGKIRGVTYDHFGDFDGFVLETETGEQRRFCSREAPMLVLIHQAWTERTLVAVRPESRRRDVPRSVVMLAGGDRR